MNDTTVAIVLFFLFLIVLLICLVEMDSDCLKRGGTLVVVSEHQAKGTMNHTECEFLNTTTSTGGGE